VRTLADVQAVLDYGLAELLEHENSIARTRALIALAAAHIEAIKVGEFEGRLILLEAAYAAAKVGG
jgi:hypothetical protein